MTLVQHSPANNFFEPPATSDALPTRAFPQFDGTDWILATSGAEDGVFVPDENGDYVLVDVRTPSLIVADGSDFGLSTSGTAVRQLVDDAGDVAFGSDFTVTPVAILGQDLATNVVMVRVGGPHLRFTAIGGNYLGYEDT